MKRDLSVYVYSDTYDALARYAQSNNLTLSGVLRRSLSLLADREQIELPNLEVRSYTRRADQQPVAPLDNEKLEYLENEKRAVSALCRLAWDNSESLNDAILNLFAKINARATIARAALDRTEAA